MPHQDHEGLCRSCQQRVLWTFTERGRRQAVNPDPDPTGNLAVYTDGIGRLRSRGLTADRPTLEGAEWRAMPHAATCTARQRRGVRPVPWQGWQR